MDQMIAAWVEGRLQPMEKLAVHRQGLRHPAVSVLVLAGDRQLLQQRAAGKYHSPLQWANACCTHPHWGEAPEACARRRLQEELGLTGGTLRPVGQVSYRAEVGAGMIEDEVVDVFLLRLPAPLALTPDPQEVAAVDWPEPAELVASLRSDPGRFTPWFRIYMAEHAARLLGG